MLSVIPAGIFSRLRIFLGRLKPHALPVAPPAYRAGIHWRRHRTGGDQHVQPLAARRSQSVVYCPDGGLGGTPVWRTEQPAGAAVVDCRRQRAVGADRVTVGMLVPDAALACGLAAALAIAGMYFLRCLHPPGGAVALTAILGGAGVHSEGYHFVLTPVLLNSLMLALLAIVFNNLVGRRYPHPLAAEEVKSRAVPLGISVTREDIHAALLEGQFLDIDEDDVQELLENIEQQARQRIATAAARR